MKKHWPQFAAFLIFTLGPLRAGAGTIFYVPISPTQSDANSGISNDNGYTSAVDGGNTRGSDRVINGITLYALAGDGETSTADNCTLNALSGSLANGGGSTKSIQVDGTLKEVASDMTFNNGAGDNSQQEIVLDPESLEAGTTYDLRVYISNGSGQDRQVNLAFFGDGQEAVETGFFNEDDARTSAGGFKDSNQAYYINYRYTWDGDSTPGITITQKSGSAPFCLYALTNQVVPSAGVADATGSAAGDEGAGAGEEAAAEGGDEGLSAGFVNAESDEVGVESDDFYASESLNSNGRWIKLDQWGTSWQPTNVPEGWCPYTNGNWKNCDDCGWVFDSPEPWAWACYHYGRWAKVRTGCGWAWVPGKVWGPSWVSWRQGQSGSSCETCIGWAPLPPEADCELGVGISSWVDYTSDIGPDCYTFINVRDFGSDSYSGCGTCILDRGTYINIVEETTNITNISYEKHVNIYSGGPDYNWCNTEIRKHGGKECEKVHVNRYDDPAKLGGKYAKKEGNQLGLVSPKIKGNKNAKQPKVAESLGSDKIDKGWGSAKANNKEKQLKNHIAQETKGKTPKNTKGTLPAGVAELQKKHHAGAGQAATQQLGGKGQHPGKAKKGLGTQAAGGQAGAGLDQHPGAKGKLKGQGQLGAAGAGQAAGGGLDQHPGKGKKGLGTQAAGGQAGAGLDQHPGGKGKLKGQGQLGGAGAGQAAGGGFDQHPGKKGKLKGQGQLGAAGAGQAAGGGLNQQAGGKGKGKGQGKLAGASGATSGQAAAGGSGKSGRHPGQSLKGSKKGQAGLSAQKKEGPQGVQKGQAQTLGGQAQGGQGQGLAGQGGKGGKGKHKQQQLQQSQGQPQTYGQAAGGGQGGGGKGKHKQQQQAQQLQQPQGQPQTYGQATGGGQGGGGKGKHKQQQQAQQAQAQPQTYGQATGGGQGGGGKGKHKQQQQAQQFQQAQAQQQTYGQAAGGGQGGGGKGKHKQQQQAQQFQQQQAQQQQLQQQQAQHQQRQLQQQQAQQQQLQQQQAQQQQQGGKKGKKNQTPPPY